jgi:hypothetical protein
MAVDQHERGLRPQPAQIGSAAIHIVVSAASSSKRRDGILGCSAEILRECLQELLNGDHAGRVDVRAGVDLDRRGRVFGATNMRAGHRDFFDVLIAVAICYSAGRSTVLRI